MADSQTILSQPSAAFCYLVAGEHLHGKVLDVGCGNKPYRWMFPDCEWVGLDARPVGDIEADAHQMPIPDEEYDSVLCAEVLHLCLSPIMVMREITRVVKPGGAVAVTVPNCHAEEDDSLWGIKARGLEAILQQAGLEVIDLAVDGQLFTMEWFDHKSFQKYGVLAQGETDGWLNQMNKRYPAVTLAIARKPETPSS